MAIHINSKAKAMCGATTGTELVDDNFTESCLNSLCTALWLMTTSAPSCQAQWEKNTENNLNGAEGIFPTKPRTHGQMDTVVPIILSAHYGGGGGVISTHRIISKTVRAHVSFKGTSTGAVFSQTNTHTRAHKSTQTPNAICLNINLSGAQNSRTLIVSKSGQQNPWVASHLYKKS